MKKGSISLAVILGLTGCNLAPRYTPPEMELPGCWRTENDATSTLCNIKWWQSLQDPVLDALINKALDNNKDLQTAMWRVNEFYAQYHIVRSALFPQIDLSAGAAKEKFPTTTSFLPTGFDPIQPVYSFDFNLSYEIDFWGQIRNETRAAYSEYLAQVENRRTVVLTLISSVAQTYILLRQLDMQYDIAQKTLKSRLESLQIAQDRFHGGLTSEIEVAQAASTYDETWTTVKNLEREIPQTENLLSVLLGEYPQEITRGKSIDCLQLPPEVPTGLPSELLQRRPDIRQAENILIAANANIGVARAAFFPQISLTGLFGGESFQLRQLFNQPSRAWSIGGNLLQIIFAGGRLVGQLRVSEAQKKEALFQYEQTILNAFREVDDALIAHKKAKELITVQQANVNALEEYLYLAWLQYYEGQTDYLTVLDAQRKLFEGQLQLANFEGSEFITLVGIYKALGGGWVTDADSELRIKNQ